MSMKELSVIMSVGVVLVVLVVTILIGGPYYRVWSQEMRGKAMLAEATQLRQVQVEQARAELESEIMRADAIKIIGEVAQKYPEYRTQELIGAFVEALKEGKISQSDTNIFCIEYNKKNKKD